MALVDTMMVRRTSVPGAAGLPFSAPSPGCSFSASRSACSFSPNGVPNGVRMGVLATEAIAGHQIAVNLVSFAFMIPIGIGAAVSARVGQETRRADATAARRAAGAARSPPGLSSWT